MILLQQFFPAIDIVDPDGLESFLLMVKRKYGDLPIYVHENGFLSISLATPPPLPQIETSNRYFSPGLRSPYNVTLNDAGRATAINSYIGAVLSAIR